MKKLKIFLTALLIATLIIIASNVGFATEANEIVMIPDNGPITQNNTHTTNITENNETNNIYQNNTTNNTANNVVNNNSVNNTNTTSVYNNTNLPKAGSADGIAIIAAIVVFGVSALYAYKKIRDYNLN